MIVVKKFWKMEISRSISFTASPSTKKSYADFSIEALLGKREDHRGKVRNDCSQNFIESVNGPLKPYGYSTSLIAENDNDNKVGLNLLSTSDCPVSNSERESEARKSTFDWLSCTRFKPPKLLRNRKKSCTKRNGRGPRIPFSTHQLAVLEKTFMDSQYLSCDAITRLANSLHLTETRVKIWFQNRRARFRREKNTSEDDCAFYTIAEKKNLPLDKESGKSSPDGTKTSKNACKKQSIRHLINDLNLMAASSVNSTSIIHLQSSHSCFDSHFPLPFSQSAADPKNLYDKNVASFFT